MQFLLQDVFFLVLMEKHTTYAYVDLSKFFWNMT